MRAVGLLVLALCGCAPGSEFHCASSEQCRSGAQTGTCEPTGYCSFPDVTCPSGLRYDGTAGALASACVDVSAGGDRDHDGVADNVDNCPDLPNPDQDNEDGDAFGDACDGCPPIASDVINDADDDGVDDACDPDPNLANHIVLFEGFHRGIPPGWTQTGTWTPSGDGLDVTPAITGTAFLRMPYTGAGQVVITGGIAAATLPTTGTTELGVLGAFDPNGNDLIACELRDAAGSLLLAAEETKLGTTSTAPWTFTASSLNRVSLTYDLALNVSCQATLGGIAATAAITLPLAVPAAQRSLGFYAHQMSGHVEWIMLVTR
ncbi:MAG: thrombospondin type 3 repeat-containing protein [Kofleriaceae bacterium]